jgi:hypothetical protein
VNCVGVDLMAAVNLIYETGIILDIKIKVAFFSDFDRIVSESIGLH